MKLYPIMNKLENDKIIALCETRADAEELILTLAESTPTRNCLIYDKSGFPIKNFIYNPFLIYDYYIADPVDIMLLFN